VTKDQIPDGMDFRMPTSRRLEVGQVIEGQVVMGGSEHVFLDVGGKSEARMDLKEVVDDDGELQVKEGDKLEGYIVRVEPDVILSRAMARSHLNLRMLEDAKDMGLPIEGKVTGQNKGGLEVDLNGTRAFCPVSQIELGYCEDPSIFVDQTLQFRVTEFAEEGRNIVLSRRALLEEEREQAAAELQDQLQVGAEFAGEVVRLQPFGAFVDIGGLQGMVHISEISHSRIEHPEEVLVVGQTVRVQVIRVEPDPKHPDRLRIGLSMRALMGDPWDEATGKLSVGSSVEGKVVRLQPFGAFVEIAPGVDGLVHVSEMADRHIKHPSEVVSVGDVVQVAVLKMDESAHRISLSLRDDGAAGGGAELMVGSAVDAVVDRIKPFGLFVRIKGAGRNVRALIPAEETGAGRNANLRRKFPEGSEVKAAITQIEPDTGRIRLSISAYADMKDQEEYGKYQNSGGGGKPGKSGGGGGGQSLGTLGDLLSGLKVKK